MHRVIVDCDNTMGRPFWEVDDGLALLYLLGRKDVELLGVTTTFGNGPLDEVHALTGQLLRRLGRQDIPLYKGEGERGQGPTEAAHFLAGTAAAFPGELTILALGPVGNLRAAAEVDPAFYGNLRQVACMGGYLHPLRLGWRPVAELNLAGDPAAAYELLHAPCAVTLMNADICLQAGFGWGDLRHVGHWGRQTRGAIRNWLLTHAVGCGLPRFYLWDLLPAVYVSYPELFDDNPTWIRSTAADLETGSLVLAEKGEGACINMPTRILSVNRFKETLFDAWRQMSID